MENNFESRQEKIPTKEEVLNFLSEHIEGYVVLRELSDVRGLFLLEATIDDPSTGDKMEYGYMRKGNHGRYGGTTATEIHLTAYDADGMPNAGGLYASLDEASGEWILK